MKDFTIKSEAHEIIIIDSTASPISTLRKRVSFYFSTVIRSLCVVKIAAFVVGVRVIVTFTWAEASNYPIEPETMDNHRQFLLNVITIVVQIHREIVGCTYNCIRCRSAVQPPKPNSQDSWGFFLFIQVIEAHIVTDHILTTMYHTKCTYISHSEAYNVNP